ncbi:ABC transporter transmembrane region [Ceratobasidium sp. AG-Ba]|nr:ABC transporter transmembrane region [Ceratobasidium sp. AG-Ba]
MLLEPSNSSSATLRQIYALAIIRFVNGLVDPLQQSAFARPIYSLAAQIGLPAWIVELRHRSTHEDLPSLEVLREASHEAMDWLLNRYFLPTLTPSISTVDSIDLPPLDPLLSNYKALMKTGLKDASVQGRNKAELDKLMKDAAIWIIDVSALYAADSSFRGIDIANSSQKGKLATQKFCERLCDKGGLVPVSKSKRAQPGKSLIVPPNQAIWAPLIQYLDQQNEHFADEILACMLGLLNDNSLFESDPTFSATIASWTLWAVEVLGDESGSYRRECVRSLLTGAGPEGGTLIVMELINALTTQDADLASSVESLKVGLNQRHQIEVSQASRNNSISPAIASTVCVFAERLPWFSAHYPVRERMVKYIAAVQLVLPHNYPTTAPMKQLVIEKVARPSVASGGSDFGMYTLWILGFCTAVSALLLALHVLVIFGPVGQCVAKPHERERHGGLEVAPIARRRTGLFIHEHGATAIFVWKVLRLVSCIVLTALTNTAIISASNRDKSAGDRNWNTDEIEPCVKQEKDDQFDILLGVFFAYATVLAVLSLVLRRRLRALANFHLVTLLLVGISLYAWRDLMPLATFSLRPLDETGGWLTWGRICILTFAAIVVPLCIPQPYVPVDPKNPATANPEQTASLISFLSFSFMDSLVWGAYRVPKIEYEQLPPLADYDQAAYLRERSFDELDPLRRSMKEKRHLFWGLMLVFRKEYCMMAASITFRALMEFAAPLGIRYLLLYFEHPTEPGFFRPWVWVALLFVGPVFGSVAMQCYGNNSLFRTEAMLTQLLFEHSLRIRMVAEVGPSRNRAEDAETTRTRHTAEGGSTNANSAADKSKDGNANKYPEKILENSNTMGKINNLMSTDLGNINEGRDFLFILLYAPIQIVASVFFLYQILGWSAVIGMLAMLISLPLPGKIAQLLNNVQAERMKKTDARVQSITEYTNVIRMIKLFAWEKRVKEQVEEKRDEELCWYKKRQLLVLANNNIKWVVCAFPASPPLTSLKHLSYILPLVVMTVTFASHTLWFNKRLDASTAFSSIGVFDLLRGKLNMTLRQIPLSIQAKVSLDRVGEFLTKTELLDAYTQNDTTTIEPSPPESSAIGFRDATFTWARQQPGTFALRRRNFKLRIYGELLFRHGKINMIVGPTGCGKTSLLMALLGEMHFVPSVPDAWFGLPRERGVAYAAQEAWIQNETIRENILFGAGYDDDRYKNVIKQCALERDLTLLEAGDQTEIGEKGITLSGGQKASIMYQLVVSADISPSKPQARVSLARAIYSNAEIIILDDVLCALDVHTARWIVDKCFNGDLVAGRTILVVTHNIAMVSEVADFVVSLGPDGCIASQGSIADALRLNSQLRNEMKIEEESEMKASENLDDTGIIEKRVKNSTGQLIMVEEISEGHVGWPALKMFLFAFGGPGFWLAYITGFVISDLLTLLQTYWLGIWANAYKTENSRTDHGNTLFYISIYSAIAALGATMYSFTYVVHVLGSVRASRRIHNILVEYVLGAPLRWLDSTPIGRIVARFTHDMRAIDGSIPNYLEGLINQSIRIMGRLVAVLVFSPIFTMPGAFVFAIGYWIGQIYIAAQLSIKREMSNARSPLFSHFGAALNGITSIRAYGAEDQFRKEALKRIDKYTRAAKPFYNLNRWIGLRMDVMGATFSAGLAAYLVYVKPNINASNAGFMLTMGVTFSDGILWWVRILNSFEAQSNSLERIHAYTTIEQEPKAAPEGAPPAYWPASGSLIVENLVARYTSNGPAVLHGLSFEIKSGERVGVVGRTGSGKSSLALSLMRMIPTEGNVYYDGIPTCAINLEALRSSITIIPQQPELMSGTSEGDEGYIGLDTDVSAGGGNFSLGQRQIIALARAIVRRSKVLILDEATAAIDYKTDTAIQHSLRTELKNVTLVIVAHRLQTICDADKVMVLDEGKILEFDSPAALLQKQGGAFKSLVDGSGDRQALYEMVRKLE